MLHMSGVHFRHRIRHPNLIPDQVSSDQYRIGNTLTQDRTWITKIFDDKKLQIKAVPGQNNF